MAERKWTQASMLGYIYIAMAGVTDNALDDDEKSKIGVCVKEWFPNDTKEVVIDEIVKAHEWFVEDFNEQGVEAVAQIVTELARHYKQNKEKPALKAILEDLVRIAIADNNLNTNEKVWINTIAEIFEIDFTV